MCDEPKPGSVVRKRCAHVLFSYAYYGRKRSDIYAWAYGRAQICNSLGLTASIQQPRLFTPLGTKETERVQRIFKAHVDFFLSSPIDVQPFVGIDDIDTGVKMSAEVEADAAPGQDRNDR